MALYTNSCKMKIFTTILFIVCVDWQKHWTEANDCSNYEVLENEIPCNVKQEIVKKHNILRQKVAKGAVKGQPRASNMLEMYWDDELAAGAQEWANHCTFEHNDKEYERFSVGQNLGFEQSMGSKPKQGDVDFSSTIQNWFDEHKDYSFGPIDDIEGIGHYTQVIWADTYLVGCGYIKYKGSDGWTQKLYVCDYGPAGNVQTHKPYEVGSTKCKGKHSKSTTYRGLCSVPGAGDVCNEEDSPAVRTYTDTEDDENCSGEHCKLLKKLDVQDLSTRRSLNRHRFGTEIDKYSNATSSELRKTYNLITINIFHK